MTLTTEAVDTIIEVEHVSKRFIGRRGTSDVQAVDDVSLSVERGETLGIVGESGSGKSTLARIMLGLIDADAGEVRILGRLITGAKRKDLRGWRADMQIIVQNATEALNPRMRIGEIVAEPLLLHARMDNASRTSRVRELLRAVRLPVRIAESYPHQLSGGQQQRVNIARAIATEPKFVLLDEPTSSLDVSVRGEVLDLLVDIQRSSRLTYVIISHDLPTIRHVCDHVAVMYRGRIVEVGEAEQVLQRPRHPYTKFLLSAELPVDPRAPLPPLPSDKEFDFTDDPEWNG